ncbi:T9SS type A sorting domain-containing protein [Ferruginibacter sp.]
MKTILYLFISLLFYNLVPAQITTPAIKANFGVDGNLKANYFTNVISNGTDDWFKQTKFGSGDFMIDTSGAAAIVAGYNTNPASRMLSFSRIMGPAFYSVLQNNLVIDAVFHRDFHGDDSTVFASGSNKNGMSPANWSCPVSQGIPDKNEILDAFTHIRRAGPSVTDSLWMFGGLSIENTNGNRYFDFELYQTDFYYDRSTNTFKGYSAEAGHTAWQFDASGNVIKAGDIIFSEEFSSSSLTLVEARIWVNKNALLTTPQNFNWGGQFDGDGNGATYGYASIVPKTAGDFYTGLQSTETTWAGPFSLVRTDNSVVTDYIPGQFLEFSVNLTKLGIDPGSYSNNPCGTPFRRVLIKTRSSTSFTSELKDFVAPFRMFDFPPVNAFSYLLYFCKVFPLTPVTVLNPNPNSIYTWTTNNGNIVGSNVGITIYVDRPGTYYVTQQLNAQCAYYSKDSVKLIFDSICRVLPVDIIDFSATKTNDNKASLTWQASANEEAAQYFIEYSLNGNIFLPLDTVPASKKSGIAGYAASFPLEKWNAAIIYFRIKVTGKDGRMKYSNIAALRNRDAAAPPGIFPNPTHGDTWLSYTTAVNQSADITIRDAFGKLVKSTRINIPPGSNPLRLADLSAYADGVYFISVKTPNTSFTQKILKLK